MNIIVCDGDISVSSGSFSCSGTWSSVTQSELAMSANSLTSSDFSYLAGLFVVWFSIAFGVKMIRRVFNL